MHDSEACWKRFLREGSEDAFSDVVSAHLNLVYSAALRSLGGDTHLAEDVSQRVFIDLARMARELPQDVRLGGWLYRHAVFTASKTVRGEQRRKSREEETVNMQDARSTVEPQWTEIAPVLDAAINELPDADREAVVARFMEGHSLRQVGVLLGISEDAARKRVDRALDRLHAGLSRRGFASTAAVLAGMMVTQAVTAAPAGLATTVTLAAGAGGAIGGVVGGAGAGATVSPVLSTTSVIIMSKTKTTLVLLGIGILLSSGIGGLIWMRTSNGGVTPAYLDGYWFGQLAVGGTKLRLGFDLENDPSGRITGSMDSHDQGVRGMRSQVTIKRGGVEVVVPQVQGTFTAKAGSNRDRLVGIWKQGPVSLPLELSRTTREQVEKQLASESEVPEKDRSANRLAGDRLSGEWNGSLNAGGQKLRLVLNVSKLPSGACKATLDSLDQNAADISVNSIVLEKNELVFRVDSLGGKFIGQVDAMDKKITGKWSQGPATLPLVLTRAIP